MAIPLLNECNVGMEATGFNVIVVLETASDMVGRVYIPDSVRDKDVMLQTRGRIVSISPAAFDFANFNGAAPKLGQAVAFARLAGIQTKLADGKDARILDDKSIAAIIEEAA